MPRQLHHGVLTTQSSPLLEKVVLAAHSRTSKLQLQVWIGSNGTDQQLHRLSDHVPLAKPVTLGAADSLKIVLTATEAGAAKRPHQAFLLVRDQDTGLEATFPFQVKESGKGKVDFVRISPLDSKMLG